MEHPPVPPVESYQEFRNLQRILSEHNYLISQVFVVDGIGYGLLVVSRETGEWMMITIPKKFTIKIPPSSSSDEYKVIALEPTDLTAKRVKPSPPPVSSVYKPISGLIELEDSDRFSDPLEVDKLMSQYQSIDLESDKNDLFRDHLFHLKDVLHRLKVCITNLKCKLCMLCSTCFCIITNKNDIDMYLVKNSYPKEAIENQEMYVCCDLEVFYTKAGTIQNDVTKIYSKLRVILEDANTSQLVIFGGKLQQFHTILAKLENKHHKRNKYIDNIMSLKQIITRTDNELKRLEKDIEYYSKKKTTNVTDDVRTSAELARLRKEGQELGTFRNDAFSNLCELNKEYNDFMIGFNNILIENTTLLDNITSNFSFIVPTK